MVINVALKSADDALFICLYALYIQFYLLQILADRTRLRTRVNLNRSNIHIIGKKVDEKIVAPANEVSTPLIIILCITNFGLIL